ncbi:MAG: aminotransferase class V-fold PLP-dependent enzyme [Candidatus Heteroscillospira sp.]|jgi:selenocysteine lyase/cysteine desulfurase
MIYLDSAATTFLKPEPVRRAVNDAILTMSSPGRGGYRAAMRAAELCYACREAAGELFSCPAERVVFTSSATHGLNIALRSLVKPGDRVVISGWEHNAVTRTLTALGASLSVAGGALFSPDELTEQFGRLLPGAACCVCTHVSNVFGYVLPMDDIAAMCRRQGVPLVVDAAQSAGCLPVNMEKWKARFIAMPGHKGLHGIQGTGLLLCSGEAEPLLFGGTGSASVRQTMPDELPDRLEAGTHNMPGIAGLLAGMNYVKKLGPGRIAAHEVKLRRLLSRQLDTMSGAEVFESGSGSVQTGVLSVRFARINCESAAQALSDRGVAVRSGLHCAPLAHRSAGTLESGTVRFSFSPMNTEAEIIRTSKIIRDILNKS